MTTSVDTLVPEAKEFRKKLALAEAAEADKQARLRASAEAAKKALLDHLAAPSGVSEEEGVRRGVEMIERAVSQGQTQVEVYRFPSQLCTDRGRAINQGEPGWEQTLTGMPKEIYQLWYKYFRPRGYKLMVEIVDFPDGMPGDIAMTAKL